jgi:hypothetical protein
LELEPCSLQWRRWFSASMAATESGSADCRRTEKRASASLALRLFMVEPHAKTLHYLKRFGSTGGYSCRSIPLGSTKSLEDSFTWLVCHHRFSQPRDQSQSLTRPCVKLQLFQCSRGPVQNALSLISRRFWTLLLTSKLARQNSHRLPRVSSAVTHPQSPPSIHPWVTTGIANHRLY